MGEIIAHKGQLLYLVKYNNDLQFKYFSTKVKFKQNYFTFVHFGTVLYSFVQDIESNIAVDSESCFWLPNKCKSNMHLIQ